MADNIPIKATAFTFYTALTPAGGGDTFQANPTLAAGDVKVSIDDAALTNITTLPVVTPASSKVVKVTLDATEMNADDIVVVFSDAAGAEWQDKVIHVKATTASPVDMTQVVQAMNDK